MRKAYFIGILSGIVALVLIGATPYMNLTLPVPGVTPGPLYAQQLVTALTTVDSHNHTAGQGAPIPSAALNINADVPFNGNNLVGVDSVNFDPITVNPEYEDSAYVNGVDFWYRDGNGNAVQITQGGSVKSGAGSISGMGGTLAAANYSSAGGTFSWLSNSVSNTFASLVAGALSLSNNGTSPNAITISAPAGLAGSYALTLPAALPSAGVYLDTTTSTSGVEGFAAVDNSTLGLSGGSTPTLAVKNGGITATQIATGTITTTQIANGGVGNINIATGAAGYAESGGTSNPAGGTINYAITSATPPTTTVTDYNGNPLTVVVYDPEGRPIRVFTKPQAVPFTVGGLTLSYYSVHIPSGGSSAGLAFNIAVSGSASGNIGNTTVLGWANSSSAADSPEWAPNIVDTVYYPSGGGTFTFTLQASLGNTTTVSGTIGVAHNIALAAYAL